MKMARALFALAVLAAASPAQAARCPEFTKSPQPEWVTRNVPPEGYYTGVGQAQKGALAINDQMALAKQAALRDLAGSIRVSVRSELQLKESAQGSGGKLQSQTQFESSTETRTEAELANVQADEVWMDAKGCVIWVRVKVEEAVVRLQRLREFIRAAEDAAVPLPDRERALAQAETLLPQVDYSVAGDGATREYFQTLVNRLKLVLANVRGKFEINDKDFRQAQELLQQARLVRNIGEQARLALPARELLKRVSSSAAYGKAPDYWPEKSMWELAEFESHSGNPCEARRLLEDLQQRGSGDWQKRAGDRLLELSCTPEQKELSALRRMAYGRDVNLICAYRIGSRAEHWTRACADMTTLLSASGATKVDANGLTPGKAASFAEQCQRGCAQSAGTDLTVVMFANGGVRSRNNPENPMGKDYQFKGDIKTYILNGSAAEFADNYTGIGGWNPVSSEMALDVIAIQAGRRFRDRASAHYAAHE